MEQNTATAPNSGTPANGDKDLKWLDGLANLMDNSIRVPGTEFRFGLDALVGLIPGVGDVAGLGVALVLFGLMMKRGAGPLIILQMMGNVILDALIGAIPVLGDLFDFGYKANRRNVNLLRAYYAEDKERPKTVWSLGLILLFILAIFALVIWLIARLVGWLWGML